GVTISNNESEIGGGVAAGEVIADDKTVVTGNSTHDGGSGGGAYVGDWTGGRFESNTATMGGGVSLGYGGSFVGATVEANHATDLGGGLVMDAYSEITNSVITAKTSDKVGAGNGTVKDDTDGHNAYVAGHTVT